MQGFIQIPLILIVIFGAAVAGGGSYFAAQEISKHSRTPDVQEPNANATSTEEVSEIDELKREIEDLKNRENNEPKVIERIIEKTVAPATQTDTAPAAPVVSTSIEKEKEEFDKYWNTYLKARGELFAGDEQGGEALKTASEGNGSIAKPYAQNSIDTCNSAYQLNLNNTPPSLPFRSDMEELNRIFSSLTAMCKQRAQVTQQIMNEFSYGSYNSAKGAIQEARDLDKRFQELWAEDWREQELKVVELHNEYF